MYERPLYNRYYMENKPETKKKTRSAICWSLGRGNIYYLDDLIDPPDECLYKLEHMVIGGNNGIEIEEAQSNM